MIDRIRDISVAAGDQIMKIHGSVNPVATKSDQTPLTLADMASHKLICERLNGLDPNTPILSEESAPDESKGREHWRRFWLVDPLDGTKEFIRQSGQFTVNIALIEDGRPSLGVVYAPAINRMYWADSIAGAFMRENGSKSVPIHARRFDPSRICIVASRDHAGPEVAALFARFPEAETRSMGSSLKFCLIAEGRADVYLRDVPTMEWDTAAAQCVVEAAGGIVRDLSGNRLAYNKPDLRNPSLVALGDPRFDWR